MRCSRPSCNGRTWAGRKQCRHCTGKMTVSRERRRRVCIDLLGDSCAICGEGDPFLLEFDHFNDNGAEHRRTTEAAAGTGLHGWILNNPEEAALQLQVLCANCHTMRGREMTKRFWEEYNDDQGK